jgi:hypothetical protein
VGLKIDAQNPPKSGKMLCNPIQGSSKVDLIKAIRDLHDEKKRLDKTIAYLEGLIANGRNPGKAQVSLRSTPSRRGRKSMSDAERRQVSERMARYWADRRGKSPGAGNPPPVADPPTS